MRENIVLRMKVRNKKKLAAQSPTALLYPRVDVSLCVFSKTFCDTSFFQLTAGIHHDIINAINNNNCNYE